MFFRPIRIWRASSLFPLLFSLTACAGCGKQAGFDSPEAAFEAYHAAFAKEDFGAAFDMLTPESQKFEAGREIRNCASSAVLAGKLPDNARSRRAEEHNRESLELLKRHRLVGVDEFREDVLNELRNADLLDLGERVLDRRVFYIERWQSETKFMRGIGFGVHPWDQLYILKDLKIKGNQALGTTALRDHIDYQRQIAFQRLNGRWYVDTVAAEKPVSE